MFSFVKSLVNRVAVGPSDLKKDTERNIRSEQELIQLVKFKPGRFDNVQDIFVEVGTVAHEQDNADKESEEAEEVIEDIAKEVDEEPRPLDETPEEERFYSWEFKGGKQVLRMSPVDEKAGTSKEVVVEDFEEKEKICRKDPESIGQPPKLEPGSSANILILSSSHDHDFSPSPIFSFSPKSSAGQSLSPISSSDPIVELFPVKVKRSFTLKPTLRSLNR